MVIETDKTDDENQEGKTGGKGAGEAADDAGGEDTEQDIREAKRLGWTPEADWKGKQPPKHGFMSAREYLDRGKQLLPLMIDRNKTLNAKLNASDETINTLKTQLEESNRRIEEVGGVVRTLHQQAVEVGKRAYDKARRELEAKRREAVAAADTEEFSRVQAELDELDTGKPAEAAGTKAGDSERKGTDKSEKKESEIEQPKVSSATRDWVKDNPWFNKSAMLNGAAIEIHDKNLKSGMTEAESFEQLTDQVKEMFPDRFAEGDGDDGADEPRRRPAAVRRPGGRPPAKNGKAFDDLPADAKAAYAAIAAHDPKYTKDKYLKDYIWD
jgi:hypothetical protein